MKKKVNIVIKLYWLNANRISLDANKLNILSFGSVYQRRFVQNQKEYLIKELISKCRHRNTYILDNFK